jgi:hypothetical protein
MPEPHNPFLLNPFNPLPMKRRIRRIANFFAFNLLFFALYLNFIHKDKAATTPPEQTIQATAAVGGTVPVSHPEKYLGVKATGSIEAPSQQ